MNVQRLSREEVLRSLSTTESGLSEAEAARRLKEYGPNELREVRKTPLYLRFITQFTHFLALLLWMAAGLCLVSEYLRPGSGNLSLALAIIGVIVINAVFTFIQEYRAERALAALKKLLPFNVKVRREGELREVPAREVVPGDILVLGEGDKIPADARLLEANRLMVNNAPLTGESDAKSRTAASFSGEYLASPNLVFAGTLMVSGQGLGVALATGMATEFGKIAHLTSAVTPDLTPLQEEIVRVTRLIAVISLSLGAGLFALGLALGQDFWHNFLFAVGLIVANVPEGLLPTVTLALAMGSQRMARQNALIKNLVAVETLGSVTVICSDKTGTLTQNAMTVKRFWVPEPRERGRQFGPQMLLTIASLCNNAAPAEGRYRGDPTEVALLRAARDLRVEPPGERLAEIPFDSDRKRMSTVTRVSGETLVLAKGALETLLPLCASVLRGTGTEPLGPAAQEEILTAYQELTDQGLRVMAFAFRRLEGETGEMAWGSLPAEALEADLIFSGFMGLEDPPRPEVPEAVRRCREAGVRVIMATGDAGRTAFALAREIGLAEGEVPVVEGPLLESMGDAELRRALSTPGIIFARLTPSHKMRLVTLLKDEGERVAVTGDGVNDAPALRKADVGVAMGVIGTDVAREAADVVLLDDNFATIVNAMREGRTVFQNMRKFISYIFTHATPEVVPYILFSLFKIPLPLTVMQILAIDLGTETVPALALGAERPEPGVLAARPGERRLIDGALLLRSWLFLGAISATAVLTAYFFTLYQGGWRWGMILPPDHPLTRAASSATWLGIVIMQMGAVFACRSFGQSVLRTGLFTNRLLLLGLALELALVAFIIYTPLGNRIFGTAPLGPQVWLFLVPASLTLVAAEELRKLLVRRFCRRDRPRRGGKK